MLHREFGENRGHGRNANVTAFAVAAAVSAAEPKAKAFGTNASTTIPDRVICGEK
jgi:hypothetical protein